ncbi:hypothetical protein PB1_13409 [Bacillus methanolicus PB1]|uniref:YpmS n=1 Tax=Bacillus methanolicus PB1 TaxID=997296 RepID=I3DWD7_BACMT|nr:YpmS family protein [Bacillus methanolicus]EIJ78558.1 hypothetical protein PB1_13409 [Bacillus methanolicus PB1]
MKNKWKIVFFLLLGINIVFVAVLFFLINLPSDNKETEMARVDNGEDVKFVIDTNKEDLNKVINHYLKKEGLTGPVDYKVLLRDEVELYGTMPVFGRDLELKLTFEPEALKNGNLVLKQKSISIGQLQLPVSYVLNIVRDSYHLPDWVTIVPNDEMVYVALQKLKLKSDIKVKVNKFDLKEDDIQFTLVVPTK